MIYKLDNGGIVKLQSGSTIPEDEQFDSIRPAHKIDLSKARRKEIRNFARNLAGMDNPEYGATAKDYQEGFVNLGLNKRRSKFFDRVFRDQLAKNLEHTNRVNRDQQVIQAVKEGNFDPEQFGEWIALKRDESPVTQKFVMPLVTGTAFGPAMAVASLAGEATNLGTNAVTGWDTWGKALASGRKGWSEAAELTNPGYVITAPLANGGQRLIQGWKTVTNSTKDLQNQTITKIAKELNKNINKSEFIPAQVKYYGPTMGKSYAAKTNPNLIDLDTWGRSEYDQLAKKYGYKDWREMILSDNGDYNKEYKQLIKDQISRIQSNPQYSGKTIVVSNASFLKPSSGITFDNTPVIPERSVMATRNNTRHSWESIEHGEEWWDSLQRKGTPLKIDNRFISDIEGNKAISFTPVPQKPVSTVHFDPRVKPLSRPISEAERLGIPKSMRSNPKALEDPYYWGYQQWNQRYNAAVESGNMEEVQRLRDLHFKLFTPENKIVNINGDAHKVYHGSPANWYIFDDYKRGVDDAIYFSSDKNYADQFTIPRVEWKEGMIPTKESRAFYLYGKEPIDIGDDMYYGSVQDALIHNWANNGKADSVYGLDAITPPLKKSNGIEFGIVRKNQAKLADPITYDNFKRIISIVKRDNFHNPDIRYKSGGILKGQHGILTPWYNLYNSKVGEFVRDSMFGKDYDLSDEEYVQKHGYAKPITGTGMLPGKTSMNAFEGVENLVKGSFGTGAKYNAGQQIMKTNAISKTVQPKTASNWDKFLKKSLDEQNKIVKYWDERYSTMRQLQANQKQFRRFVNWINKQ